MTLVRTKLNEAQVTIHDPHTRLGNGDTFNYSQNKAVPAHYQHEDTKPRRTTKDQEENPFPILFDTALIVSPYLEREHLLDLTALETQDRLMALAMTFLEPTSQEYATCGYEAAFNWGHVIDRLQYLVRESNFAWKKKSFYVVEFRSKLKEEIDNDLLFLLDKQSHAEATESGGLLKYWYGSPNAERQNLATCLWRSREDAVKGGRGSWHQKARTIIPQMYEMIRIKGIHLTIEDGVSAWKFSPIVA